MKSWKRWIYPMGNLTKNTHLRFAWKSRLESWPVNVLKRWNVIEQIINDQILATVRVLECNVIEFLNSNSFFNKNYNTDQYIEHNNDELHGVEIFLGHFFK